MYIVNPHNCIPFFIFADIWVNTERLYGICYCQEISFSIVSSNTLGVELVHTSGILLINIFESKNCPFNYVYVSVYVNT